MGRLGLLLASLVVMILLGGCGGAGASRAPQGEGTENRRATLARLEMSPTDGPGVRGSATLAEAASGTRVELELRGLPEPGETYLAHLHPGSCNEEHHDAHRGENAGHHGHEHAGARTAEISHPLTPVESNDAGEGSSITVLESLALNELLMGDPGYLNVHAAGSGDPPQLACADLDEANQHTP